LGNYRYFIVLLIKSITYGFDDFIDLSQPSLFFLPASSFSKRNSKPLSFSRKASALKSVTHPSSILPQKMEGESNISKEIGFSQW